MLTLDKEKNLGVSEVFYKDTDSFFATKNLPPQQNKKIVPEKAQRSLQGLWVTREMPNNNIRAKGKIKHSYKRLCTMSGMDLLVITVPEKLMLILGRSALSPSCKFLMSPG